MTRHFLASALCDLPGKVRAIAGASLRHRSAALRAEPAAPSHRFAPLPRIAGDALLALFLFFIIFGLPGLFAGV